MAEVSLFNPMYTTLRMRFKMKLLWLAGCGMCLWFFCTMIYVNNLHKHSHKGEMKLRTKYRLQNLRDRVSERWSNDIYRDVGTASMYSGAPTLASEYIDDGEVAKYVRKEQKNVNNFAININNFIEHKWKGSSQIKAVKVVNNIQEKNTLNIANVNPYVDVLGNKLRNVEPVLDRRQIVAQVDSKIKKIKENEKLAKGDLQVGVSSEPQINSGAQQTRNESKYSEYRGQISYEYRGKHFNVNIDSRVTPTGNSIVSKTTKSQVVAEILQVGDHGSNIHARPKTKGTDMLKFQAQQIADDTANQQFIQLMHGNRNSKKHPTLFRQIVHVNQNIRDSHASKSSAIQLPQQATGYKHNANQGGDTNGLQQPNNNDRTGTFYNIDHHQPRIMNRPDNFAHSESQPSVTGLDKPNNDPYAIQGKGVQAFPPRQASNIIQGKGVQAFPPRQAPNIIQGKGVQAFPPRQAPNIIQGKGVQAFPPRQAPNIIQGNGVHEFPPRPAPNIIQVNGVHEFPPRPAPNIIQGNGVKVFPSRLAPNIIQGNGVHEFPPRPAPNIIQVNGVQAFPPRQAPYIIQGNSVKGFPSHHSQNTLPGNSVNVIQPVVQGGIYNQKVSSVFNSPPIRAGKPVKLPEFAPEPAGDLRSLPENILHGKISNSHAFNNPLQEQIAAGPSIVSSIGGMGNHGMNRILDGHIGDHIKPSYGDHGLRKQVPKSRGMQVQIGTGGKNYLSNTNARQTIEGNRQLHGNNINVMRDDRVNGAGRVQGIQTTNQAQSGRSRRASVKAQPSGVAGDGAEGDTVQGQIPETSQEAQQVLRFAPRQKLHDTSMRNANNQANSNNFNKYSVVNMAGSNGLNAVSTGNNHKLPPLETVFHPGDQRDSVAAAGKFHLPSADNTTPASPRSLTSDEYLDLKDSYNRHSFNVVASDNLSLRRPVPDTRPPGCRDAYDVLNMPRVSVVICFHNEAWSTLLRTIHSVLVRTPPELLQEIILVDDFSTRDYLGGKLEAHVAELPKVFLLRTTQREGLARARMRGVSLAKGEILVFLDSHCECNQHWVEPLVQAIQRDRMKVVSPQMDIIEHSSFAYKPAPDNLYGSFGWTLQFSWKNVPLHEANRRKAPTDGIRTPAMAGGLFAIDKYFFYHLGGFDSGMEIWGSENLELSLRVWMCGGSIEILPCSRVGHVFRATIPYGFPDGPSRTLRRNTNRVAEIWLDEYKGIYYATQSAAHEPTPTSSIQERLNQRRKLKCKSFRWYMYNILPELHLPPKTAEYFGQMRNGHSGWCLSVGGKSTVAGFLASTCDENNRFQTFTLTSSGDLMHRDQCLTYFSNDNSLVATNCDIKLGNFQKWSYTQTHQLQLATNTKGVTLCLDLDHKVANKVTIGHCLLHAPSSQVWTFTYQFDPLRLQQDYPSNVH